jgi:hypothetical protein
MLDARHVYEPEPAKQFSVLPAAVAAEPALAEMERTSPGGYDNVQLSAAGCSPAGEVKFRSRVTVPFAAVLAEDKFRAIHSVCAQ